MRTSKLFRTLLPVFPVLIGIPLLAAIGALISSEEPATPLVIVDSGRDLVVKPLHSSRHLYNWKAIKDVEITETKIVVLDSVANKVWLLEKDTNKLLTSTSALREEGQPRQPVALVRQPRSHNDALWVYDFHDGELAELSLNPVLEPTGKRLHLEPGLFQPSWTEKGILTNGFFPHKLLRTISVAGPSSKAAPGWGESPFKGLHSDIQRHLNRTTLTLAPSNEKLALAFALLDRIDIFNSRRERVNSFRGPLPIVPRYTPAWDDRSQGVRVSTAPNTKFAYVDATSSESRIYALFSGRPVEQFGSRASLGREVHAFKWTGELVGIIKFAEDVHKITFDPATEVLICVVGLPQPRVVSFSVTGEG